MVWILNALHSPLKVRSAAVLSWEVVDPKSGTCREFLLHWENALEGNSDLCLPLITFVASVRQAGTQGVFNVRLQTRGAF